MADTKEWMLYICRVFLYFIVIILTLLSLYILSYYITTLGALIIFLILSYLGFQIFAYFTLFPPCFPMYTKPIIKNYSKISTFALKHQANEFCSIIDNIKTGSNSYLCFNLISSLDSFFSSLQILQSLKYPNTLTPCQQELLTILQQITDSLSQIQLLYSDQAYTLKDWYDKRPCGLEKCEFIKETLTLSPAFVELDKLLERNSEIFSSLNCLRADLVNKYDCQRTAVEMFDKVKLDCVWIPSGESEVAVIICNSNGQLYEFSSFQSDWVKFYLELGYSVFMWNYRGYGLSQGWPSISKLKKDGENIVNFIRTEKLHIKVLGVHGESLGGCIAVHLAKECLLDFLVADRTFTCLRSVALFTYGKIGYWLSRLLQLDSTEYIGEYLSANCTKVIISDPNDKIIQDMASLKAGVAVRLLSHDLISIIELSYLKPSLQAKFNHIISYAAATSCVKSLLKLKEFLLYFKDDDKYFKRKFKYLPLRIDTEDVCTDTLAGNIDRMLVSVGNIDAGGKSILEVLDLEDPALGLIVWLMVLDIWGCCSKVDQGKVTNHIRSVFDIRNCLQEIQSVLEEFDKSENLVVQEVGKEVNTVFNVLIEVLGYMEERCGLSSNLEISIDRMVSEYACAGELIPVCCGHLGTLSQYEKSQLSRFLLSHVNKVN